MLHSKQAKHLNTIASYILGMATTIQISVDLLNKLRTMKIHTKESYEDLIWDLIEDRMELSEETKKNIIQSEKDLQEGRIHRWEDVKKELGLNV